MSGVHQGAGDWSEACPAEQGRGSSHPGTAEAAWVHAYERGLRPLFERVWPHDAHGFERIPEGDDYLIVANHSGLGIVESVVLAGTWLELFGDTPLAAMAHPALFRLPGLGDLLRGIGAVEATREGAAYARARGRPLLLFPGGDHESMRPLWRAKQVDFAGRTGWVRLAREHRLRIVPLAITGSHVTLPNLAGSRALAWLTGARLFGMRRAPLPVASVLSVAASLHRSRHASPISRALRAGVAFWAAAFVPWVPARIGLHVLEPLELAALQARDDEVYDRVTRALSAVVSRVAP